MIKTQNVQAMKIYPKLKLSAENTPGTSMGAGNALLLVSPTVEGTLLPIGSIYQKYQFRGYYLDRTVMTQWTLKKTIDRKPFFDKAKELRLQPAMAMMSLRGKNFSYDLSNEVQAILSTTRGGSAIQKRAEMLVRTIADRVNMVRRQRYDKVTVVVILDEAQNINEFLKAKCPASLMLLHARRHQLHADLGADYVIFYSPKTGQAFKLSEKKCDPVKMQSMMRTMVNANAGMLPDNEDANNMAKEDGTTTAEIEAMENGSKAVEDILDKMRLKGDGLTDEETDAADELRSIALEISIKNMHDGGASNEKKITELLSADGTFNAVVAKISDLKAVHLNAVHSQKTVDILSAKHQAVATDLNAHLAEIETKTLTPAKFNIKGERDIINNSTSKVVDTEYATKLNLRDRNAIITHFGDDKSDFPVFLESVSSEDTSDPFTKKETLTLKLNTLGKGRSQTFKVDLPKFSKNGELLINGTKKQLLKQLFQLPIIKIRLSGEDAVQYNTFYNKCIMTRSPGNLSPDISRLKKYVAMGNTSKTVKATPGNSAITSKGENISLEYGEVASVCSKLKAGDYLFNLNLQDASESVNAIDANLVKIIHGIQKFPVGVKGAKAIVCGYDGEVGLVDKKGNYEVVASSMYEIVRACLEAEGADTLSELESISAGSKQTYTVAKIHDQKIPLIVVLGFKDGIETVLERANIHYEVTPPDRKTRPEGTNRTIRFKDFYFHYDGSKVQNDILVAGLGVISDHDVNWTDLKKDGDAYHKYFMDLGVTMFARSLRNFYQFFLDPVTKSILQDIGLPDDLTGSILYCNSLLADPRVSRKNDLSLYRIRSQEVVNHLLYKRLADAIALFKDKKAEGMSIKQNSIIRDFLDGGLVEEQPILNPALEAEGMIKTTFRGTGGAKFGHAQGTEEFRAYDKKMIGIFGSATPNDLNVGTLRKLAYNANITSPRGYMRTGVGSDNLDPTQMLGVGELLTSFTSRHADPYRQTMSIRHSEHTMPTIVQHKPMMGSGMDFALAHYISDEFAFKAKEDGEIDEVNEKKHFAIVKYASGEKEVIDLSERQRKTNVGGFFITTRLSGNLKKGQKFKAGTILAKDDSFFKDDHQGRPQYMSGVLCKVAIAPLDGTLDDSSVITERASHKLASWVTFSRDAELSAKATVEKIVKIGQTIKAGDSLMIFEESFEGDTSGSINKMLEKLSDKDTANLEDFGKTVVPSKYGGEIVDIHVVYNVELKDMSVSIRKIVESFIKDSQARADAMHGAGKDQILMPPHVEKISETKIRGTEFEGVLFTFFIKTYSSALSGEKIAFEKAAKSIVSTVLPDDQMPLTADNVPVDCILSPLSVMARMTPDVLLSLYTNKVLLALKNKVKDIVG